MSINNNGRKQIDETEEFRPFSEEISYLSDFFSELSEHIQFNGHIITFFADSSIHTLDPSLIASAAQTIKSIKLCCSIGSFSDANALIRKLRDDLIQYTYVLHIINLRKPFTEESLSNVKTDSEEEFANTILNLQFNNNLTEDEQAVLAWFNNRVAELDYKTRKKLEFENYMTVLKKNNSISEVLTNYELDNYWGVLRKRLNDYVHSNGTSFSRQNYVSWRDSNLDKHLKNISTRTNYVASFFVVVLLMIDSSLISSTDYIDHLDCGLEPSQDSQYFVADFVQEFIDNKISKLHPELKQYLQDNNINGMKIE